MTTRGIEGTNGERSPNGTEEALVRSHPGSLAEEILRRQLDFTAAITASLAEGLCAVDDEARITFVNPAAEAALGCRAADAVGRHIGEVLTIESARCSTSRDGCPLLGALREGTSSRVEDDSFIRRDGQRFPASYTVAPIRSAGRITGAVLAFHDITARRREHRRLQLSEERLKRQREMLAAASENLEQTQRRYRDLVENLTDVVYALDCDGCFRYVSPAVDRYGYTPDQLVGRHFSGMVYAADLEGVRQTLANAAAGISEPHECRVLDSSGGIRFVRASSRPMFENGQFAGITGLIIDITEQRRTEERSLAAQRIEAVGRLAGGVAHDFNNLLVVINGYAEFAMEGIRKQDPIYTDLQEILSAGQRAAALTRQLLAFSRKQVLKPEVIDLNDVLRGMEGMLRRLIGEDVQFETTAAPDLGYVLADPGQMEQVVMNLIVNARDAMPTGGTLVIQTRNESAAAAAGHPAHVLLSVTDTGCGMDEATRAQIFEPFFSTKGPGEGTGLGLSTVHGIVTQSGGTITVDSRPGEGSTFTIALPIAEACPTRPARPVPAPAETRRGSETILLVEDEPAVRNLAKRFLTAAGYRVLAASNGGEALLTCEKFAEPIDLLLTDVVMPQMSGPELRDRLATVRPGLLVLYMSGYSGSAIAQRGVGEAIRLVKKPFNSAELTRAVRAALERA